MNFTKNNGKVLYLRRTNHMHQFRLRADLLERSSEEEFSEESKEGSAQ